MKSITALRVLYRALIKGDERSAFTLSEKVTQILYPRYKFSEPGRSFLCDEAFLRYYESFEGRSNYHSLDRKYALDQLMKLVCHLGGDTAECGACQGASSYLICRRIVGLGKLHHVFDSFEGLSAPRPEDGTYWKQGSLASSQDILRERLKEFDFVVVHKGWIPERFHDVGDRQFCFLHVDVDLFQPTLESLLFFYTRMVPGGIILCDDYGFETCPGARKAMDSFFADKPEKIASLPTGQGLVIKR